MMAYMRTRVGQDFILAQRGGYLQSYRAIARAVTFFGMNASRTISSGALPSKSPKGIDLVLPRRGRWLVCIAAAACILMSACRKTETPAPAPASLVETMSFGPVVLTMTADPPLVRLDRDVFLKVRVESPPGVEVRLPPINDRLIGFTFQGSFDREPVEQPSGVIRERSFRLTPTIAEEYRISPMAVTVVDGRRQPADESWFATSPVTFKTALLTAQNADSDMRGIIGPVRVLPSFKIVAGGILAVLAAIAACAGLWLLLHRIRRAVRLRRMSPKERALHELEELIAKDLIAGRRVKDFYAELTMIVRRYIERAHKIRAPEQTTEEFLAAAAAYRGFRRDVVRKLRDFLQSADLVKFAAFRPDPETIARALDTARDYIKTDELSKEREIDDV